ncbi:metallophosphoesterase 1 isoform X1 [Strongylocentrotus purpuratus]|uniref:Calcineurin-like phosphoesterase domain-containing protein n=2 Tax=Strongylocentrotus purpuratus TaxID=7668 RepID=A0A7M7RA68_STRPU|nr:metallophosphoesterase 1 isoform X1 [Strongylocentrotus purpuratus]
MAGISTFFKPILWFITCIGVVIFICEYLVYYVVMFQCSWPDISVGKNYKHDGQTSDSAWLFSGKPLGSSARGPAIVNRETRSSKHEQEQNVEDLRAIFIADTHLLGSRLGHWFDKLRREWQMERGFQTSLTLFSPEAVFVLGDLTDEGQWASDMEFEATAKRFRKMFHHSPDVYFKVVVGNHDVGFHDFMSKRKLERFSDAFNSSGVEVVTLKNNSFVLVNSMAFHGDGCSFCSSAQTKLRGVSERLNCSRFGHQGGDKQKEKGKSRCSHYRSLPAAPPILLQHFPLYRPTDEMCSGIDGTPLDEKYIPHGQRREVLSQKATDKLLSWIHPRLVLSAHTHHGCYIVHQNVTPEISVPSFSWRNRKNPSLILASISPTSIAINKCFLPEEYLILILYAASGVTMATYILYYLVCILCRHRWRHVKEL